MPFHRVGISVISASCGYFLAETFSQFLLLTGFYMLVLTTLFTPFLNSLPRLFLRCCSRISHLIDRNLGDCRYRKGLVKTSDLDAPVRDRLELEGLNNALAIERDHFRELKEALRVEYGGLQVKIRALQGEHPDLTVQRMLGGQI